MRFSRFSKESLLAIPDTPALGGEVALENFPELFSRFVEAVLYRPFEAPPSAISLIGSRAASCMRSRLI